MTAPFGVYTWKEYQQRVKNNFLITVTVIWKARNKLSKQPVVVEQGASDEAQDQATLSVAHRL